MQYVSFTCKLLILNVSYYSKVTEKVEDLAIHYRKKKYCTSIFIIYSNFLLLNSHRILLQESWTLRWFLWCPYCPRFLYSGGWARPTARLNMDKRSDFLLWGGRKAIMKREVGKKIGRHRGSSGRSTLKKKTKTNTKPSTCELWGPVPVHTWESRHAAVERAPQDEDVRPHSAARAVLHRNTGGCLTLTTSSIRAKALSKLWCLSATFWSRGSVVHDVQNPMKRCCLQ